MCTGAANHYSPIHNCVKQRGVALLILMLALILIITVGLLGFFDPAIKKKQLEQRTQDSLVRAKEALIAYAISTYDLAVPPDGDAGIFVKLPCPDTGTTAGPPQSLEGEQNAFPTCVNYAVGHSNAIGMLPWATLNMEAMRDSSEECLWYALSGSYKSNPNGRMLNEDSPGQLLLYAADGNSLISPNTPDRLVAAIFAPGPPLPGQNRNPNPNTQCGGNYNATDFLEAVGVANNAIFSNNRYEIDEIAQGDANSEDTINDRVITVSKTEIWNAIQNRAYPDLDPPQPPLPPRASLIALNDIFGDLTRELAQCIADYGSNRGGGDLRLPWAVPVNSVAQANWFYADEANYIDQPGTFGGRFPFSIQSTVLQPGLAGPNDIFTAGVCTRFDNVGGPPQPLYRNLWRHWKDHIFYAVAQAHAPGTLPPTPVCGAGNCLTVNVSSYAAIVFFAGGPLIGQSRDGPQEAIDEKTRTDNYLEGGNDNLIDNAIGVENYAYNPGNDIMVCVGVDPLNPLALIVDTDCNPGTPQ